MFLWVSPAYISLFVKQSDTVFDKNFADMKEKWK